MVRLVFIFLLTFMCYGAYSQSVVIKKTDDIVVIKGKSYYLHVVEQGQTLFSICKAYGVDVNLVKELNDKKDNSISLYEVLKIPYVEPYVKKDSEYYYHRVLKGETLYSIARRFNVKVKRILKDNPQYDGADGLSIGAVVRLALNEIDTRQIDVVPVIAEHEVAERIQEKKPEEVKIVQHEAKEESKKNVHEIAKPDTVKVIESIPAVDHTAFSFDAPDPDHKSVKVVALLPLYARDIVKSGYGSDTAAINTPRVSAKSEQFIWFYEGLLLAVDSLKNKGYTVDLHVFDTERNPERMLQMMPELNRLKPELIIGPVYASVFKVMIDNLEDKNIPVVYPLSSLKGEDFVKYPNFIQVNPSFSTMVDEMTSWIVRQSGHANIINVNLTDHKKDDEHQATGTTERKMFKDRLKDLQGVRLYNWNLEDEPVYALKYILKQDQENIIILPTTSQATASKVLQTLTALADNYKITVVGFPEWLQFTSVDYETFYKLNVKLFMYNYVDYSAESAKVFANTYRKYFHTEPNGLVNKAFDIGLYFIELTAKYRDKTLDALDYYEAPDMSSKFKFSRICDGCGRENRGFYIVHYSSDYQIRVEPVK